MLNNTTGIYHNGDRVDIQTDPDHPITTRWIPGTIQSFKDYTVRSLDNRTEHRKTQNNVRRPGEEPVNELYHINEQVEMRRTRAFVFTSWVPGAIVKLNYNVLTDTGEVVERSTAAIRPSRQEYNRQQQRIIEERQREDELIREEVMARNREEGLRRREQNERNRQNLLRGNNIGPDGLAFEIHNAFDKFKINEFMRIINKANGTNNSFKNREKPLQPLIDNVNANTNLSPEKKTELTQKIARIFNTLRQYESLPEKLSNITACIQYVLMQPQDFIDIYIDTFITDCLKAYSSGDTTSCVKGMYERIYFAFRDTVSTICLDQIQGTGTASLCKPEYIEIFDCFYENIPTELLNEYSKNWFQERSEAAESMSPENRIKDFVSFVREKINNPSKFSKGEASIRRYAATNINVLFGGRQRRSNGKSRRPNKKTIKKRKNCRSKRSVIKTIKKHR
jgi:hypothetical protein